MQFREATAADREAILDLRARCFGDVDAEKRDPRFWDWEFGRARIFVGEEDGRLASHLALVELPGSNALAVDAMTAPEARGKGAFSGVVAYAMASTDFPITTAYQIRSAVLGSMLCGGFVTAGRVPILIRPILFPLTRPSATLSPLSRGEGQITLRPAKRGEGARSADEGLRREDCEWMGRIARTPEFLAWRFFDNPRWKYRVTGVRDQAYLVARRTTLKGYDTFAIADFAWRDAHAARVLLGDAIGEARAEGCRLIAAFVSRAHPAFKFLLLRGFLPGPHWFRLLVHPRGQAKRTWRVMWADTDHV